MVMPEVAGSLDLQVCMSACECDRIGTKECVEDQRGNHLCKCHAHFTGIHCTECDEGYYRNGEGYCEKVSTCADIGGEEDCSGHGTCYQEGPTAICECDPGFANDGLDLCGRCADPLMTYPHSCTRQRNWVLEQEDFECEALVHTMPRKLYKDPHDHIMGL